MASKRKNNRRPQASKRDRMLMVHQPMSVTDQRHVRALHLATVKQQGGAR